MGTGEGTDRGTGRGIGEGIGGGTGIICGNISVVETFHHCRSLVGLP